MNRTDTFRPLRNMSSNAPDTDGARKDMDAAQLRESLRILANVLMDAAEPVERLRASVADLEEMLEPLRGIPSALKDDAQRYRLRSPTGEVISPGYAISTMTDAVRTAKYLRGLVRAIRAAREKFPGERIEIIYAGPGPNAPFLLLVTPFFAPEEIAFTLLEVLPESAEGARRLIEAMELGAYVSKLAIADAVTYKHEGAKPHIAVAEIMLRALRREGQFAVFKNLAPQLVEGGFLVPEEIELHATLTDPHRELSNVKGYPLPAEGVALRRELGSILKLSLTELLKVYEQDPEAYAELTEWPTANFIIPALETSATTWTIMTRIRLFEDLVLEEGESGLTMPSYETDIPPVQQGDEIHNTFQLGAVPGLYCRHQRPRMRILP